MIKPIAVPGDFGLPRPFFDFLHRFVGTVNRAAINDMKINAVQTIGGRNVK